MRWLYSQPYLLLTLTAVIWAGNAIAGRVAAGHISPYLLTSLRWLVATSVLLILARGALRRDWTMITRHWPYLAFMGSVGFMLFNNLFYLGLNYTSAVNGAIIQAGTPLMVFFLNFFLFRLRSTWLQIFGFCLTLVGVVLTTTGGDPLRLAGMQINIGDAYVLIASFAYGVYSAALVRKPPLHWLSFVAVLAFFALISSIPFAIWEYSAGKMLEPDLRGWLVVLFAALAPAILAQIMWIRGLEMIGSNRGGIFINLVPIFAAAMAVAFLREPFHLYHAVAMALVVGGVWISQKKPAEVRAA